MEKIFKDGFKRVVAAALSVAVFTGFAGCDAFGVRKSMGVMNDRLINYNKALNKLDYETVRSLTDWTGEDSDYMAIVDLFDTSYYGDSAGEGFVACSEYIVSTISINYDITAAEIYRDQATLEFEYEMVDWQDVYHDPHGSYDEVLEDLKNCPDKITIDSVIIFEKVDEEADWRLCKISDLGEVMSFIHTLPVIDND